ncbi:LPS translocon maturation chaperone LptM [Vibrio sp. WXL103]|uniref:LPS translocon maturation chaperone LptM n=1 Tax=Vibrio sp. WXL103 TaxID=3450710 RepID=UPI003EC50169
MSSHYLTSRSRCQHQSRQSSLQWFPFEYRRVDEIQSRSSVHPIAFLNCGAIIGGIEKIITTSIMKNFLAVIFMLSSLALVGCGQSGALTLPQDDTQNEQAQ